MSIYSSACKTSHVPPSTDHSCDPVGLIFSQGGCLVHDQGQLLGADAGLMEMPEVEYTHLQHLIQTHLEAQAAPPEGPDARSHPAPAMVKDTTASAATSPFRATQAIDLSTSSDDHCLVLPGEKTPASYGEVPGFVLARVRGEDSPPEPCANGSTSPQKRSRTAARVCLEKRFNTVSADTPRQQNIQSAVLNNFLTLLQQSAEAQEAVMNPEMQKWMKTDRPFEVISHIPHMVEPNHQGLIIPKGFPFSFHPERVVTKAHFTSGSKSAEEQQSVNVENGAATLTASGKHDCPISPQPVKAAEAAPDSAGESGSSRKRARSHISLSQRRERHNSKERERRRKIRWCCDELNMLVPFCDSDTDKVTTLRWTTAFLRYLNKTYGDIFREEFQKAFTDEKGLSLKSSPSSGQDPIHREMEETPSIPLTIEQ